MAFNTIIINVIIWGYSNSAGPLVAIPVFMEGVGTLFDIYSFTCVSFVGRAVNNNAHIADVRIGSRVGIGLRIRLNRRVGLGGFAEVNSKNSLVNTNIQIAAIQSDNRIVNAVNRGINLYSFEFSRRHTIIMLRHIVWYRNLISIHNAVISAVVFPTVFSWIIFSYSRRIIVRVRFFPATKCRDTIYLDGFYIELFLEYLNEVILRAHNSDFFSTATRERLACVHTHIPSNNGIRVEFPAISIVDAYFPCYPMCIRVFLYWQSRHIIAQG